MGDEAVDPGGADAGSAGVAAGEVAPGAVMPEELKAALRARLSKLSGQVLGINGMIENDRYCPEVLDQIAAVQKALDGVSKQVMRNYLEHCVTDAIQGGDPLIYDEVMRVLFRHR